MADSILPYTSVTCFALLIIFLNFVSKSYSHSQSDIFLQSPKDHLLCRQCGADLASSGSIVNHLSPEATVVVNQTLFGKAGVEIQVLTNPLGIQFGLITVSKAFCVGIAGKWHTEFSWFPGYAWKHCMCNYCSSVLGWMFEPIETATSERIFPSSKGFYALILNQILSETFANSLLVVPKSYRN
ncbi:protein cereblon homolog [Cephus cinctus]|uniref:Protein cereblon homolog n=1 Tax=Cephus cinctus TaxID=211228 RepID=A0AAJ7C809_CEPCN|nr:protein cereblon homolog [Cephus cinctus]